MKAIKFTLSAMPIILSGYGFAQSGQWKLTGNDLTGTEKFGSTNNQSLKFFTNNKPWLTLTPAGNLNINSDQSSIQFAVPGLTPKPMMFMFPSGNNQSLKHSSAALEQNAPNPFSNSTTIHYTLPGIHCIILPGIDNT